MTISHSNTIMPYSTDNHILALEIDIDRMVSGEMPRREENDFLAVCEIEPQRWRDVALGFVETRRLREALREHASVVPVVPSRPVAWGQISSFVMAASLLLAVGMGFGLGRMGVRDASLAEVTVPSNSAFTPSTMSVDVATGLALLHTNVVSPEGIAVLRNAGAEVFEAPVVRVIVGRDGDRWIIPERQLDLRFVKQ